MAKKSTLEDTIIARIPLKLKRKLAVAAKKSHRESAWIRLALEEFFANRQTKAERESAMLSSIEKKLKGGSGASA